MLSSTLDWHTLYAKRNDANFFLQFGEKMNVERFVDFLDSGDVIFSRSNTFFGSVIQYSGHCMWNHVSMCVKNPDTGEKYWWESTNSNDDDDESCKGLPKDCAGNFPTGARIWPMLKRLKWMLNGRAEDETFTFLRLGVCKLYGLSAAERERFERNCYRFVLKESGKGYERTYWPLILSWYDGWRSLRDLLTCFYGVNGREVYDYDEDSVTFNRPDVSSYFCSELVMETFLRCGLLKVLTDSSHSKSSGEWTVADIANANNLNAHAREGIRFSETCYISLVGR